MTSLVEEIKRARRISTPIIAITTTDQQATIDSIVPILTSDSPCLSYDIARGPMALNELGKAALSMMIENEPALIQIMAEDPARAMIQARLLPQETVLFFWNAQRHVSEARVAQAIAVLRDDFKKSGRALILLAPQITLSPEIAGDVMVLDEPLPDTNQLDVLLTNTYDYTRKALGDTVVLPDPPEDDRRKIIESVRGLHAAAADQAFAFSMEPTGIDINRCWTYKRNRVEQTRGLSFYKGKETYADIGGLKNFMDFMTRLYGGPRPFKGIVWIDEIEKVLTGSVGYSGDGGVGADQLNCILTEMEDNGWTGAIAVGPPGAGKSIAAKATGNTFGVPCIRIDLGAVKGSLLGESEGLIRQMFKVVRGILEDGAFFIATCNSITSLPPELKRRFSLGRTWFFDLPDPGERKAIWKLHMDRLSLLEQEMPNDDEWTGSDIRDLCEVSYRMSMPLIEAASFIIPNAKQNPESLKQLRQMANGTFTSASYKGPYMYDPEKEVVKLSRKMNF